MTDKQTIDDCIHLNEWKHCDICEKLIKTKDGANGKKREHLLTEEELRCDFYPNCYRKQVLRKERQCERLKKEKQGLIKDWEEKKNLAYEIACKNDQLKQTLKEIKPILEFYANSKIGEQQEDGSYKILLNGDYIAIYDSKPARQALQKISEVE